MNLKGVSTVLFYRFLLWWNGLPGIEGRNASAVLSAFPSVLEMLDVSVVR